MSIVMSLVQINQRLMLDVDEQIVKIKRLANHERKDQQIIQVEWKVIPFKRPICKCTTQ